MILHLKVIMLIVMSGFDGKYIKHEFREYGTVYECEEDRPANEVRLPDGRTLTFRCQIITGA